MRTVASAANYNNEIGVPLTLCRIERGTEAVVCELGMRGAGQIAYLTDIAAPDVGVITSVGPVHLELMGTVEAVAAAKAEILELGPGAVAVVPYAEPLLEPPPGRPPRPRPSPSARPREPTSAWSRSARAGRRSSTAVEP